MVGEVVPLAGEVVSLWLARWFLFGWRGGFPLAGEVVPLAGEVVSLWLARWFLFGWRGGFPLAGEVVSLWLARWFPFDWRDGLSLAGESRFPNASEVVPLWPARWFPFGWRGGLPWHEDGSVTRTQLSGSHTQGEMSVYLPSSAISASGAGHGIPNSRKSPSMTAAMIAQTSSLIQVVLLLAAAFQAVLFCYTIRLP